MLSGEICIIIIDDFIVYYMFDGVDVFLEVYVVQVGEVFQEVFDIQVDCMGWVELVWDDDGMYWVFIVDVDGVMGVIYLVQIIFDNLNMIKFENIVVWIVFLIENDFCGLGKEVFVYSLMCVIVIYEFNYVVQFGYDFEEVFGWFYEFIVFWIEIVIVGVDQDVIDYVVMDYEVLEICWMINQSGFDYVQWILL